MSALRIAFAGTPEFALPALEAIAGSRHALIGVLTQPDRPKGRGRQLSASPVKSVAQRLGVALAQPSTLKSDAAVAQLRAWLPDVLVVVAYGLILPPAVLQLPRLGCINIHASLLPRWRGAAPIQRAILAGEDLTGVTIMRMDVGLDTGPMLLQRAERIHPSDTAASLQQRLARLGAQSLLETLEALAGGSAAVTPQPAEGVSYAAKIDKSEALIHWSCDAPLIDRQIRAFNPWPIAETRFEGEQLRIHAAQLLPKESESTAAGDFLPGQRDPRAPGTVLGLHEDAVVVSCGAGLLALTELQRPGRRPTSARDWANSVAPMGRVLG